MNSRCGAIDKNLTPKNINLDPKVYQHPVILESILGNFLKKAKRRFLKYTPLTRARFPLKKGPKMSQKSMLKGRPKVVISDEKFDLGRSKVDLSDVFG